ncbi:unnamed protein product [Parnassius apollo]|uniref:(apollo) hypothetical protein n=1 Tax=Parnassius apollo TaxID=110799 RepID=A0A8S3WHN6_PARAO|nr:unnamed protein product [Parnassius apollo]
MHAWACWLALALAAAGARELDPAACSARFDVQRDKIIRTEESREMGARYLAELDVGSRAECLRLCCETDACDVFVFEEKSPGSCYLFACGPPEDFRCKFTAHGNFSSGVLALSRRLAELQDQERLAHHERELANLRNPTSTSTAAPVATPAAPQQPPQQRQSPQQRQPPQPLPQQPQVPPLPQLSHQLPQQTLPPQPQQQPPPPTGRCSRYQFECRRGGECIAVYNACDGVPQCADGSDEAPELGCPAPNTPAAPPHAPPPAAPLPATDPPPPPPPQPHQQQPQPPPQVVPDVQRVRGAQSAPSMHDYSVPGAQGIAAEGVGVEAEASEGSGELWPRRLAQAQHRYTGLAGEGSAPHIFSHQGGLLQAAWPHRAWPPEPPRNEVDNIDNMGGLGGMGAGSAGGGRGVGRGGLLAPGAVAGRASRLARAAAHAPRYGGGFDLSGERRGEQSGELSGELSGERRGDLSGERRGELSNDRRGELSRKQAHVASATAVPPAAAHAPSVHLSKPELLEDATKKKTLKPPAAERVVAVEATPAPWGDEHDGPSEHPPVAVLLLVLGSLMTVSLGVLVACRARAAAAAARRASPWTPTTSSTACTCRPAPAASGTPLTEHVMRAHNVAMWDWAQLIMETVTQCRHH